MRVIVPKASMPVPMYRPSSIICRTLLNTSQFQENISAKIGLILSFSLILIWGARLPVVRTPMGYVSISTYQQCAISGSYWTDCRSIRQTEK